MIACMPKVRTRRRFCTLVHDVRNYTCHLWQKAAWPPPSLSREGSVENRGCRLPGQAPAAIVSRKNLSAFSDGSFPKPEIRIRIPIEIREALHTSVLHLQWLQVPNYGRVYAFTARNIKPFITRAGLVVARRTLLITEPT